METVSSRRVPRSPRCARCRNHGFSVALKGHVGRCRFSECRCWKCSLITERTRIMATQRGIRKRQRAQERERGAGETAPVEAAPDSERGADTGGKTFTELQVPAPGSSGARAPGTDPEIPEQSSDQCPQERIDQPHLPREHFVYPGVPQSAGYSGEMAMGMPFNLHAHYSRVYTHHSLLLTFGVPPIIGPIGFPPNPLMGSRQEDPGFVYMPYVLRHVEEPYIRERADGADTCARVRGHDPGACD